MIKEESATRTKVKKLLKRLSVSRFIKLGALACIIGIGIIIGAEYGVKLTDLDLLWHVARDVGIALVVAGTVGIGAEFVTRNEAFALVEDVVRASLRLIIKPKLDELGHLIRSDHFRMLGVKDVFPDRSDHSCQKYLEEAAPGSEIRLLGISMGYLASKDIQRDILHKLDAGSTVKLLLLDLDSKHLLKRGIEEARRPESTPAQEQNSIRTFLSDTRLWRPVYENFAGTLPPGLSQRFELRYYAAAPGFFLIDNGARMLVGFYLRGCSGDRCPHFELTKGGAAYEKFSNHFDLLWASPRELEATGVDVIPASMPLGERRQVERRRQPLVEASARAGLIKSVLNPKVSPETGDSNGPM